ncbi:DUF1902 domain-containing protein [Xanthobacter sp. V7C-4]|uniref:DUF1902 domain-containing protein n=1 Tax=Xanthobacter autotrophicus (strain ATCC BAA-1158 / Py2) TaxID=78245 RepID=UPI00372903D3
MPDTHIAFDAFFDADAGVWVATSDAHRMTTEAGTKDLLKERLLAIVPDVLESRLGRNPGHISITINWQEMRTVGTDELMVA